MRESAARSAMVEMVRNAPETHGRDRFSCTVLEWRFLLDLATTFGWQPRGTTYELPPKSKVEEPARRDYEPGESSDRKRVDAGDAKALAHALANAQAAASFTEMVELRVRTHELETTAAALRNLVKEFIEYAYGGAFMFARSATER